jgi:hypothetical protein
MIRPRTQEFPNPMIMLDIWVLLYVTVLITVIGYN